MRRQRNLLGPQGMGGMVGLWGASSPVASVQYGAITIDAAYSNNTAAINAVDTANSRLVFLGAACNNGASNSPASMTMLTFTSSTVITATRSATGAADVVAKFVVIEYRPGVVKSIQRGSMTISGASGQTAAITSVNTARSVLEYLGFRIDLAADGMFPVLNLSDATTVRADRYTTLGNSTVIPYQVVEYF